VGVLHVAIIHGMTPITGSCVQLCELSFCACLFSYFVLVLVSVSANMQSSEQQF